MVSAVGMNQVKVQRIAGPGGVQITQHTSPRRTRPRPRKPGWVFFSPIIDVYVNVNPWRLMDIKARFSSSPAAPRAWAAHMRRLHAGGTVVIADMQVEPGRSGRQGSAAPSSSATSAAKVDGQAVVAAPSFWAS